MVLFLLLPGCSLLQLVYVLMKETGHQKKDSIFSSLQSLCTFFLGYIFCNEGKRCSSIIFDELERLPDSMHYSQFGNGVQNGVVSDT